MPLAGGFVTSSLADVARETFTSAPPSEQTFCEPPHLTVERLQGVRCSSARRGLRQGSRRFRAGVRSEGQRS